MSCLEIATIHIDNVEVLNIVSNCTCEDEESSESETKVEEKDSSNSKPISK